MPVVTLQHANREQDARAIATIAAERGAGTIVVGYPVRLDGTAGASTERVDRFIGALKAVFAGDVIKVDERMSTAAASKRLLDSGLSGSKRRKVVDQLAAVEILQTHLTRMRRAAESDR